jgi:hypothetical protein
MTGRVLARRRQARERAIQEPPQCTIEARAKERRHRELANRLAYEHKRKLHEILNRRLTDDFLAAAGFLNSLLPGEIYDRELVSKESH